VEYGVWADALAVDYGDPKREPIMGNVKSFKKHPKKAEAD
jgi:hypothetical protein